MRKRAAPKVRRCPHNLQRFGYVPLLLVMAGCERQPPAVVEPKPAEVTVVLPVEREFTEFADFTGHLAATEVVELRARVSGYLEQSLFQDGDTVHTGQSLFKIDSRSPEAELAKATAAVAQLEARQQRLTIQLQRTQRLAESKAVTKEELENLQAEHAETRASIEAARAAQRLAELNLSYTQVAAPIDGWISKRMVDPGNLIKADETVLAVIVALDPLYVYFDVDERTALRVKRLMNDGEMPGVLNTQVEVQLSMADEQNATRAAIIDYAENQIDANSGTLRVRARLANPDRLLTPGGFVRCRVPISKPRRALCVPEESLGADQGQRFLLVVNDQAEVQYRRIKVGPLLGNQRVVEDNLQLGEQVIVAGLQRVRPGAKVTIKTMSPSPTDATRTEHDPSETRPAPLHGDRRST